VLGAAKTNSLETNVNSGSSSAHGWTSRPRVTAETAEASTAGAPVPAPAGGYRGTPRHAAVAAGARRLRVLMVDDSDIVRKVTGRMLEKLGCIIEYAMNGSEAVSMCQRGEYDLVLMDCQMPIMDGPSAARLIRAHSSCQPRIVAFTANILEENRRMCMEAGMDDFVTKPLDMDDLANLIGGVP
jgi:CheY-like chemotaxis protein